MTTETPTRFSDIERVADRLPSDWSMSIQRGDDAGKYPETWYVVVEPKDHDDDRGWIGSGSTLDTAAFQVLQRFDEPTT